FFFDALPGTGLIGMCQCGDHGGGALYGDPLHIMFDPTDTAHLFAAARAARSAMYQQWKGTAMTRVFFGAFVIQDEDPAVVGSRSQHILPGNTGIGRYDRAAKRALSFFRKRDGFGCSFVRHDRADGAKGLYCM